MIPATSHSISWKFLFNTWTTREQFYPDWILSKEVCENVKK
jgi:hypothetical protein